MAGPGPMAGISCIVAATVLATHCLAANPHPDLGGYRPASNVVEHSQIALDIKDFTTAVNNGDWTTAKTIYTDGRYSCKSATSRRTLQGFVNLKTVTDKLTGEAFFSSFTSGNGPINAPIPGSGGRLGLTGTFWDKFMMDALQGEGNFNGASIAMRKMAVKKGVLGVLTMYTTHELESAISKMPNTDDAGGAPHAWDEGWAFYYGSHVSDSGADSGEYDGAYSAWEFAYKRDIDYGYASNGDRTDAVLGSADILPHFRHGLNASRSGNVTEMVAARNNIYRLLALASIRAALKYAYKAQHPYSDEYLMEAYVYFLCAAGWVEQASSDVGKNVLALLDYKHNSTQLTPDLYCAVKAALIPAYEALGLDCQKVGTWKELPSGKTCNVTCPTVQDDLPTGLQSYVPDTDTSAGNNVDCHPDYQLSSTETESSAALGASGISLAAVLCTILRYS